MKRPLRKAKIIALTILLTTLVLILYSNLRSPQNELAYKIETLEPVDSPHFRRVLGGLLGPPMLDGNRVVGLYDGDQIFPAMLAAIRNAKKTITFESYIYWSGDVGERFVVALTDRARAGVKVHVLLDWVGSEKIDPDFTRRMKEAGVEVEYYHVLKWYNVSRMNNRTHRKILVVDGKIGFTGGVGIADEWSGDGTDPKHWHDTHYQATGPVVTQMQSAFMDNWLKTRPEIHQSLDYFPDLKPEGGAWAQMFKSSSREGGSSVRIMYLLAIAAARKSIKLEGSYFVPDDKTIDEIVRARERGVEIEIIAPGLTDSKFVRHVGRAQWGKLLKAGVKFYEYQPAMFHCKVFIVDDAFVSIGSTNFDERSFRLNDEANLNVIDRDFAMSEARNFEKDKARSRPISLENWQDRPLWEKLLENFSIILRSQL